MSGSRIFIILVGLILLGGAIYFVSNYNLPASPQNQVNQSIGQGGAPVIPRINEFNLVGGPFWFRVVNDLNKPETPKDAQNPTLIRVKKGELVKINFKNTEGTHDLVIDEFNVNTEDIKANNTVTVQFVADKTGTFEYYCSVGNGYHRQQGMVGTLIVEE